MTLYKAQMYRHNAPENWHDICDWVSDETVIALALQTCSDGLSKSNLRFIDRNGLVIEPQHWDFIKLLASRA